MTMLRQLNKINHTGLSKITSARNQAIKAGSRPSLRHSAGALFWNHGTARVPCQGLSGWASLDELEVHLEKERNKPLPRKS